MIRRGFWLVVGAVAGVIGYRRVVVLGRRITGRELTGREITGRGTAGRGTVGRSVTRDAVRATREVRSFSRDVREGMELYSARRPRAIGPTLGDKADNDVTEKDDR